MTIEFTKVANLYGNGPATTYIVRNAAGEVVANGVHSNRPFAPWTLLVHAGGEPTFKTKAALVAYVEGL